MRHLATRLTVTLLLSGVVARADTIPSFQGMGHLLPTDGVSTAFGVARDGSAAVGWSTDGVTHSEAFLWTAEQGMIALGHLDPGRPVSLAYAVADGGAAAVGESHVGQPFHAFRWTPDSAMVDLGDLPGGDEYSGARGVSADGSVVVGYGVSGGRGYEAFRWTAETGMVGLGFLPGHISTGAGDVSADGSVIVGRSQDPYATTQAFRWTPETGMIGLPDLPGGAFPSFSGASAVSAAGDFIVGYGESSQGVEAVRWTAHGQITSLGDLPGGYTDAHARGISADGSVVVGAGSLEGSGMYEYDAFLWDEAHGMRLLKDVLEEDYGLDLTGWRLIGAWGVSDDGRTIVGEGWNPEGLIEAWIARVPEPATLLLLGSIALASAGLSRRRPSG